MAVLSAAEKRDADPERRQIYLNKKKERWRKDIKEGKKESVRTQLY